MRPFNNSLRGIESGPFFYLGIYTSSLNEQSQGLSARESEAEEGLLVLELTGKKSNLDNGIKYLRNSGVSIQPLARDIKWNEEKCVHCTACLTICPAGAFSVNRQTMEVSFDKDKCIACELCVKLCPYHAMETTL